MNDGKNSEEEMREKINKEMRAIVATYSKEISSMDIYASTFLMWGASFALQFAPSRQEAEDFITQVIEDLKKQWDKDANNDSKN